MQTIVENHYISKSGDIRYYHEKNEKCPFDILFIHGLGTNKEWFSKQFNNYSLNNFSWIVPDLLGHGKSEKPQIQAVYTMGNQADILMELSIELGIKNLIIIAHSMGGPIAVSLIEHLSQKTDIRILGLFYLEGNLDINDAYLSGKFAAYTYEDYTQVYQRRLESLKQSDNELYDITKEIGPYPFWASSIDLVAVSKSNLLLPRLQEYKDLPMYFIFGALNKGRFSSEALIKQAGLPLLFIPDAGHMMYLDNPEGFWEVILEAISK